MPADLLKYVPVAALCICLLALGVSGANVAWSVYKELSLRGRVRVSFGYREIFHETFPKPLKRVLVAAVNHGPGSVKLSMVIYRKASLWRRLIRKTERGVIIHDYNDPLSGRLPHRLDVGDALDIMLGTPEHLKLSSDITQIGISDTFGRSHWATKRDMRDCLRSIEEEKKANQTPEPTAPSGRGSS